MWRMIHKFEKIKVVARERVWQITITEQGWSLTKPCRVAITDEFHELPIII